MRLIDLNPRWVGNGGDGITDAAGNPVPRREAVALEFDCPCGCGNQLLINIRNPPDGGPPLYMGGASWELTGKEFESLSLEPSIRRIPIHGSCGWHGFVRRDKIETCSNSIPPTPEFVERCKKFNEEVR